MAGLARAAGVGGTVWRALWRRIEDAGRPCRARTCDQRIMSPTHTAALLPLCVCYQRLSACCRRYASALVRYGVDTLLSPQQGTAEEAYRDRRNGAANVEQHTLRKPKISHFRARTARSGAANGGGLVYRGTFGAPPIHPFPPAPPRQRGGERVALCRQGCRDIASLHPCLEREALRITSRAFAA